MRTQRAQKDHGPCDTCGHAIARGHLYVLALAPDRTRRHSYEHAPWNGAERVKFHRGCPHPQTPQAQHLGPFPFVNERGTQQRHVNDVHDSSTRL